MPIDNRPMLWTCDRLPHVMMVGSIHFLGEDSIPTWLDECLIRANAAVVEFDRNTYAPPPAFAPGLDVAAPATWARVVALASDLGTPDLEDLRRRYPHALATELARLKLEDAGFSFEHGVDKHVLDNSAIALGLETFPEHYAIVHQGPSINTQIQALELSLDHLPDLPVRIRAAITAWQAGNAEGVLEVLQLRDQEDRYPEIGRALFTMRHELWLPRLERFVVKASELNHQLIVAVGTAHLAGPRSLLLDIEERWGCRFEQVATWPSAGEES